MNKSKCCNAEILVEILMSFPLKIKRYFCVRCNLDIQPEGKCEITGDKKEPCPNCGKVCFWWNCDHACGESPQKSADSSQEWVTVLHKKFFKGWEEESVKAEEIEEFIRSLIRAAREEEQKKFFSSFENLSAEGEVKAKIRFFAPSLIGNEDEIHQIKNLILDFQRIAILAERKRCAEMKEHLEAIVDGSAFDEETGFIWKHRLEAIEKLLAEEAKQKIINNNQISNANN